MRFLTGLSKSTQLDTKFITIKISFFWSNALKTEIVFISECFGYLNRIYYYMSLQLTQSNQQTNFHFELKKYGVKIRIYKLVMILFLCCLIVA